MLGTINSRMREIRESLNISQTVMAKSLGMKQSSYSQTETNAKNIRGTVLKLLQLIYNINIDYLKDGKGEMFMEKRIKTPYNKASEDAFNYKILKVELLEQELKHKDIEINLQSRLINTLESTNNKFQQITTHFFKDK